jgi:hypothetical protein
MIQKDDEEAGDSGRSSIDTIQLSTVNKKRNLSEISGGVQHVGSATKISKKNNDSTEESKNELCRPPHNKNEDIITAEDLV